MTRRRNGRRLICERFEPKYCLSALTFVVTSDIPADGRSDLALADLDDDGDLDILAEGIGPPGGGYPLSWVERIHGDQIFANAEGISVGAGVCVSRFEPAQLRGDDAAVGVIVGVTGLSFCRPLSDGPSIGYLERFEGDWRYTHLLDTEGWVRSIRVADLDGDGDKDIVAIHDGGLGDYPPGLVWSENTGGADLAFGDWELIDDDIHPYAQVSIVDLNGDERPDLLRWRSGGMTWYDNNGLDFEEQTFAMGAADPCSSLLGVADVDGDLDLDVVAECTNVPRPKTIIWYENNGRGGFEQEHLIDTLGWEVDVIAEDVDGDGAADVLCSTESPGEFVWYPNIDGKGVFERQVFAQLPLELRPGNFLAGDADGDGDVDLLIAMGDPPAFPKRVVLYESRLIGDSDDDGDFDASDLVAVLQSGKYEDGIPDNATFDEGDWNQDGEFDSSDLVLAFQAGHYEHETQPTASEVAAAVDWLFAQDQRAARQRAYVA